MRRLVCQRVYALIGGARNVNERDQVVEEGVQLASYFILAKKLQLRGQLADLLRRELDILIVVIEPPQAPQSFAAGSRHQRPVRIRVECHALCRSSTRPEHDEIESHVPLTIQRQYKRGGVVLRRPDRLRHRIVGDGGSMHTSTGSPDIHARPALVEYASGLSRLPPDASRAKFRCEGMSPPSSSLSHVNLRCQFR